MERGAIIDRLGTRAPRALARITVCAVRRARFGHERHLAVDYSAVSGRWGRRPAVTTLPPLRRQVPRRCRRPCGSGEAPCVTLAVCGLAGPGANAPRALLVSRTWAPPIRHKRGCRSRATQAARARRAGGEARAHASAQNLAAGIGPQRELALQRARERPRGCGSGTARTSRRAAARPG
jgi:hypothetical protein